MELRIICGSEYDRMVNASKLGRRSLGNYATSKCRLLSKGSGWRDQSQQNALIGKLSSETGDSTRNVNDVEG